MKMKTRLPLIIAFLALTAVCHSQQNTNWNKWSWLIGEWKGEGGGQPGQGSGTFSFSFDLDKNIVVRKSHSEYPAANNKPKIVHDDLMIVHFDASDSSTKAIYFDNEGHTISYSVAYTDKSITLTSVKVENAPFFRLTYELLENETVNTRFQISRDGVNFTTYVEGKSKKIK